MSESGIKSQPKNHTESLLVEAILELQDVLSKVDSTKSDIENLTKSLNDASSKYIDTLDQYTESKKNEISEHMDKQITMLILISNEIKEQASKIQLNNNQPQPIKRKKFLGIF